EKAWRGQQRRRAQQAQRREEAWRSEEGQDHQEARRGEKGPSSLGTGEDDSMQYMAVIYIDEKMLDALPPGRYEEMMRDCLGHADALRREGKLIQRQNARAGAQHES